MTDGNGINPAWNEILNVLPQEFHSLVTPALKKWDQGFHSKLAEVRDEYKDYANFKEFVDNGIDPQFVKNAVYLAEALQNNPGDVLKQINEGYDLGYISPDEAAKLQPSQPNEDEDLFSGDDIFKDPRVKAMKDSLDSIQTTYEQDRAAAEEQRLIEQFEQYITGLEQKCEADNVPFNRDFITALMSQGISGEDALTQFHQLLASQGVNTDTTDEQPPANNEQPPPVMGGEGSVGSGTPDGSISIGSLSKNALNATVEQMLAQQANSGQG
jgi:hypothetical protein